MKILKVSSIVFLMLSLFLPDAWGEPAQATFSLYLFQEGKPVTDAELSVESEFKDTSSELKSALPESLIWLNKVGGNLKTDADGSVAGKLPPGQYRFIIKTLKQRQEFQLTLQATENVQLIMTLFQDGKKPLLDIDSSHAGLMATSESKPPNSDQQGTGIIRLDIKSIENAPIKNASVFLSGLEQPLITDKNGSIEVQVPVGIYTVSVIHPTFSTQSKEAIDIVRNEKVQVKFRLTPAGLELPEYVVLEPHFSGSLLSAIQEQKDALQVSSILSAEQFRKSGDSDTASALKRVSGLTLIGGQFIFIRGLGERFSSTLINGAAIPSPDPTRRVVPMDLIPTSILDSVLVQKGYSPDRPGEFAGGVVELRTLGIPDEFYFNVNASGSFNTQSAFNKGLTYKGGDIDFLGFDDGTRALPSSIAAASENGAISQRTPFNPNGLTPSEIEMLGEDLSDVWDVRQRKNAPDASLQTSIGDVFDRGGFRLGYTAAGGWKQEFRNQNEIIREVAAAGSGGAVRVTEDFDVQRSWREVQLNGYGAAEIEYKDQHRLFAKTIFLRQTKDEARISEGAIDQEITRLRRTKLWNFSNQLFMHQFGGGHQLEWANNLKIDWLFTNATAKRDEPKTRDFRFDEDSLGAFFFSRRADNNQTSFGELTDDDKSWRVDVELPVAVADDFHFSLIGGFIDQQKQRESNIQRFIFFPAGPRGRDQDILSQPSLETILSPENIGADGFLVRDSTRPTDSYRATQDLFSYYGKLNLNFFDRLTISGGVRWEDNQQLVQTFQSVANQNQAIETEVDRLDVLPAVSATLSVTENQQLRAGFSQTISRPDFRELSPAPFTDPSSNQETTGNPDLIQTDITSIDARWEYYPSERENMSVGYFYKTLTNPIEKVTLPGVSLQTFQNNAEATLWGFEVEFLKGLSFIHPALEYFDIGSNYTWSKSAVVLTPENLVTQTSSSRALQGHSKHIFNARLGYDNPDSGTQATLLYNVASERIIAVGLLGAPDKFEQPFHQVDFVVSQSLDDQFSLKLSMRNLLNDTFIVRQGDVVTREFKKGREFKIAVSFNF
ncbi:MAG: TonB-dependent receptor [Gammaproteobacteria bacterium HGW-Gammaproteobacteria-3]|nr:MAG: TonB-dependent receptor [Gammaproteobacteria bacterium HGW-Gammaproteobacteria-3]